MTARDPRSAPVVIVGGGLGGLGMAASLGAAGFNCLVLEQTPRRKTRTPGHDLRTTALATAAQALLDRTGVWPHLAPGACPIRRIHVADRDSPPALGFDCHESESGAPFGWIVENGDLRRALEKRLAALGERVRILAPAKVESWEASGDTARLALADGTRLETSLVIASDGRFSGLRDLAGIPAYGWDYGQTALVATVRHTFPHDDTAVENFMPGGPLATLPMRPARDRRFPFRSALVWCEAPETARFLLELEPGAFEAALESRAGSWLGRVRLDGARALYPLTLRRAVRLTAPRLALISEAAHGIHPIAGQGLNLGMRDIATLTEALVWARGLGLDPGHPEVLRRYADSRRLENGTMVLGMDMLVRLFSNASPPLEAARRFGLGVVKTFPAARRFFIRAATVGLGAASSPPARQSRQA